MFTVAYRYYEIRENRSAGLEAERVGHTHTFIHFIFKNLFFFLLLIFLLLVFQCKICVQNDKENVIGNLH